MGEKAWADKKRGHLILVASAGGERPSLNAIAGEGLRDIIKNCWDDDPHSRPEFVDIFFRLAQHADDNGSSN
jgi:hypothetical protein